MSTEETRTIYFLKMSPRLPEQYKRIAYSFSQRGVMIVPVSINDLMKFTQGNKSYSVMMIMNKVDNGKYFLKKIQKILHMLLRTRRMHLYLASSFKYADDTHLFGVTGNYHYYQLPLSISNFCDDVMMNIKISDSNAMKWPGASRRLGKTVGN